MKDTEKQAGLFLGRCEVPYAYGRYGYTRGNGRTWHGGLDLVGVDDTTIRMPYYHAADGSVKSISGTVTRARIVTDRTNPTWEWGYYVCVTLDDGQTPDVVNFLYFCHCASLLVKSGTKVKSGDALGVMGATGNAAGGYAHCHFEVRKTATSVGLSPTAYLGFGNAVGVYGKAPEPETVLLRVGPLTAGDAAQFEALAERLAVACCTADTDGKVM